jgi:hypothetical protein
LGAKYSNELTKFFPVDQTDLSFKERIIVSNSSVIPSCSNLKHEYQLHLLPLMKSNSLLTAAAL